MSNDAEVRAARDVLAKHIRPMNTGAAWNILEGKDDDYWLPIVNAMLSFASSRRSLEGEWEAYWRLKPGLTGLKQFLPDSVIQASKAKGRGWVKHYEPVCAQCPRLSAVPLFDDGRE